MNDEQERLKLERQVLAGAEKPFILAGEKGELNTREFFAESDDDLLGRIALVADDGPLKDAALLEMQRRRGQQ